MRPPICLVLTSCEVPDTQKYPPSDFWIEVRFDCIAGFDCHSPEKHDAWLSSLLKLYKNVLITFRPQSRVEQQNEVRYLCYCHWIKMGVPYIDVDFYEPFTEELLALCKHQEGRTQIILSHHIYQYDGNLTKIRHIIREIQPRILQNGSTLFGSNASTRIVVALQRVSARPYFFHGARRRFQSHCNSLFGRPIYLRCLFREHSAWFIACRSATSHL